MMTRERFETTSGSNIPQANGRIIAAAGEYRAIGAERDGSHPIRVALQNAQAMTRMTIPQPHRVVITATCKHTSIGTPRQGPHPIGMTLKSQLEHSTERVIDPNLTGGCSCCK